MHASSSVYDAFKLHVRRGLPADKRELYDLFAVTGSRHAVRSDAALQLAQALAEAAVARSPLFDPTRYFSAVRVPVLLAHGRHDALVPFTECARLDRSLGSHSLGCTVTGLYAHSGSGRGAGVLGAAGGWLRMAALMRRLIRLN